MQIDLSSLSIDDLSKLIREASLELAARMSAPVVERIQSERPVLTLREPNDSDKDFALMIAAQMKRGIYATAAERQKIAQIAQEFGPWISRQGLPTSSSAGEWKRRTAFKKSPRANER